ncbi:hypothetical protein D9758_000540 [Tetrapyrgos nigripes]|uniref:Uncharacterized protein n=1 Tax=Tetrapyrgos nigripes TaxID=182062 RepID=A0A8H5LZ27_9AGAR|nr:hypothetical protein D9758_000540 [Tetrapyrgos nigripes]
MTMHKDLFLLLREYGSLTSPKAITFPSHLPLAFITNFLIRSILSNPHFQRYPPATQFQQQWWKRIISLLEEQASKDQANEIDSRIFDYYVSLLPSSGPPPGSMQLEIRNQICGRGIPVVGELPSKSFITHFWKSATPGPDKSSVNGEGSEEINLHDYQVTTLQESRTLIESGTTGLRTWPASHVLAQYLIDHPEDLVENNRILELGCGIGFLGIIVATLQQLPSGDENESTSCVWLTDVNEEVLIQCRRNLQLACNLSSSHPRVHYHALDWSDALGSDTTALRTLLHDEINPSLILGADIVFDPSLVPLLVALLSLALGPTNLKRLALIALTVRNQETFDLFLSTAKEQGLHAEDVDVGNQHLFSVDAMPGSEPKDDVRILRFRTT